MNENRKSRNYVELEPMSNLEAARRRDAACRGERRYARKKQLELEQRELARKQFCEQYGFDE